MKSQTTPTLLHPLAMCDLPTFLQLTRENTPYPLRSLPTLTLSALLVLLHAPSRLRERLVYGSQIRAHSLNGPPTFIVGHWRSGTTFLHNVMSRSERFSTINFAQAMRPHSMVSSGEKFGRFIKKHLPEDREFDSVPLSPNEPQEEEMALTCMSIHSTYHQGIFRRNRSEILEKALYVKLWSDDKQEQFASTYDYLAKKISFADKAHRPLLLKNPANTTRIDFLREIYPEARFIHIVRKPSDVIRSFRSTLEWMFQHYSLHGSCHLPDLDVTIAEYTRMMRSHLEQREGLGEQCYCEVHYESLRDEPMKTVRSINESLGLKFGQPEFEKIQTYLESVADYQPTQRDSDPEWESKIANEVAFAYQQWGYE